MLNDGPLTSALSDGKEALEVGVALVGGLFVIVVVVLFGSVALQPVGQLLGNGDNRDAARQIVGQGDFEVETIDARHLSEDERALDQFLRWVSFPASTILAEEILP